MSYRPQRRSVLQAGVALGAAAFLPGARACEYFATTMRVYHPWTRASAKDADSAILSMQFDDVTRTDRLIAVQVPMVADSAELDGKPVDFVIPQGLVTKLGEEGVQLRLVGLQQPLQVGRFYPMRLTFEHGGVVNAGLNIDFPPTDLKRFL